MPSLIRSAAIAILSGFLSGVVTLGIGCRLAMRVVALLASDADQGTLTDFEAVVGDISIGGTIFLALLGGAAGTVGGVLYAATHHRLAWAGRWRGLVFGIGALLALGSALVESGNPDFDRLGLPLVNVAMFGSLFVFFGVVIAPVYNNMQRAVPAPSRGGAGYALSLLQAAGLVLTIPAMLLVFVILGGDPDLRALVLLVTLAYLLFIAPLTRIDRVFRPASAGAGLGAILRGMAPLAPVVGVGLILDAREIASIL